MFTANIQNDDALSLYEKWPIPSVIMSDGPYGLKGRGGYVGDIRGCSAIAEWYRPHVEAWTKAAGPHTTLWLWNSELGWAHLHSLLDEFGWEYRSCCIWNKGISHVAGRTNSKTLRTFPVSSEICVHYTRPVYYEKGSAGTQEWMRSEWKRTGLPYRLANEACGVKDAATRKYLSSDWRWYFPPKEIFEKLVDYANEHGIPEGRPYFSLGGKSTSSSWNRLQGVFNCPIGKTNVWDCSPVRGKDRMQVNGKSFENQKPAELIDTILNASTNEGDVVWEPFGGSCPAMKYCIDNNRDGYASEIDKGVFDAARLYLKDVV